MKAGSTSGHPPLSPEWASEVEARAIADRLAEPESRRLLLIDVPPEVMGESPVDPRPNVQLRLDVHALVRWAQNGQPGYLIGWLRQADAVIGIRNDWWAKRAREVIEATADASGGQKVEGASAAPEDWIDRLTRGAALSIRAQVRGFLEAYCDGSRDAVPFGGRDAILEELRRWLGDPDGPAVALLAAHTGRGKSAVVARFVEAVSRSGGTVVFHPVSIRFDTHGADRVLAALVDRLAALHGEGRHAAADSVETLRVRVAQLLRRPAPMGVPLLVAIDGLDEAADWTAAGLIPRDLGDGVRVLLSQRHAFEKRWTLVDELELDRHRVLTPELLPLDRAAVEAVLTSAVAPGIVDAEFVDRIFTLSDRGDPLVLRLLVDEHRRDGGAEWPAVGDLVAGDLGLAGVWQRQVRRSERDAFAEGGPTRALIAVLATALGALERDDLIDILSAVGVETAFDLSAAMEPVRRFVLQGHGGRGYVFCHARLREHVAEDWLGRREVARWRECLLDWCRRSIARSAPDEMPHHVVEYFTGYLRSTWRHADVEAADWSRVLTEVWYRAWSRRGDGSPGYLRDIGRAREALTADERRRMQQGQAPIHFARLAHCALCESSVRSAATVDLQLVTEAVKSGVRSAAWSLGLVSARWDRALGPRDAPHDFSRQPWSAWVAVMPDDLLGDVLDIALRYARVDMGGNGALLWALLPRLRVIEQTTGLGWLGELKEWTALHFLADAIRHAEGAEAAEGDREAAAAWRQRLWALCESVSDRRALVLQVDDLVEIFGVKCARLWVDEAAEVAASAVQDHFRQRHAIRVARHQSGDAQRHAVQRAIEDACRADGRLDGHGVTLVAEHVPALLPFVLDIVRSEGRMDELRPPMGWDGAEPEQPDRLIHDALLDSERQAYADARRDAAYSSLKRGQISGLVELLRARPTDEIVGVLDEIEDLALRRQAEAWLLSRLPVDRQARVIERMDFPGGLRILRKLLTEMDLTDPRIREALLAIPGRVDSPPRRVEWHKTLAFLGLDPEAQEEEAWAAVDAALDDPLMPRDRQLVLLATVVSTWPSPSAFDAVIDLLNGLPDNEAVPFAHGLSIQLMHSCAPLEERARVEAAIVGRWLNQPAAARLAQNQPLVVSPAAQEQLAIARGQIWHQLPRQERTRYISEALQGAMPMEVRRRLLAEALELADAIEDAPTRLSTLIAIGASDDAIGMCVERILESPESREHLHLSTLRPDWVDRHPEIRGRLQQAAEGVVAVSPAFHPLDWRHRLLFWKEFGAPAAVQESRVDARRAMLSLLESESIADELAARRMEPPSFWDGVRTYDPTIWPTIHQVIETVVLLGPLDEETCLRVARRLPLGHPWGVRAAGRYLSASAAQPLIHEFWSYADGLAEGERGLMNAQVYRHLPGEERQARLEEMLAEACEWRLGDQRQTNRLPVLAAVAPDLTVDHVSTVVALALPELQHTPDWPVERLLDRCTPDTGLAIADGIERASRTWTPDRRARVMVRLVAHSTGRVGANAPDWASMARFVPANDGRIIDRLLGALGRRDLIAFVRGALDHCAGARGSPHDPHMRLFGRAAGRLCQQLVDDGQRLPPWLYDAATDFLARRTESRETVLDVLTSLEPFVRYFAGENIGAALGAVIDDVGRRWA